MKTLWTATAVMMGLRHPREQVRALIEGVRKMIFGIPGIEESSVYQDILAEGRAKGRAEGVAEGRAEGVAEGAVDEARNTLLRLGRKKLGEPDERLLAQLADLGDLERLKLLLDGLLDAEHWEDLLPRLHS